MQGPATPPLSVRPSQQLLLTVRGLTCRNCNIMLGMARNDPAVLRAAADYLEAYAVQRQPPLSSQVMALPSPAVPESPRSAFGQNSPGS